MNPLALRLHGMLSAVHRQWGVDLPVDLMAAEEGEYHPLADTGVLAFIPGASGIYVLAAWVPDEMARASLEAHRLLSAKLKQVGRTLHVVYPRNFASVKLTRKMGAVPLGVDPDGFVHYELLSERFPHGQEVPPGRA